MTGFVLDCSLTMTWCFEDELTEYTKSVLRALDSSEALVPALWPLEVANVLVLSEKRSRITRAQMARFLSVLGALPIKTQEVITISKVEDIMLISRQEGLTAYDATYLELAMRAGLPLATLDEKLKQAAKRVGVKLFGE